MFNAIAVCVKDDIINTYIEKTNEAAYNVLGTMYYTFLPFIDILDEDENIRYESEWDVSMDSTGQVRADKNIVKQNRIL